MRRRGNDEPVVMNLLKPAYRQHTGRMQSSAAVREFGALRTRTIPKQPIRGLAADSWSKIKKNLLKFVPEEYRAELVPPDDVMLGTTEGRARRQRERRAAAAGASRSNQRDLERIQQLAASGQGLGPRVRRASSRARESDS